MTFPLMVLPQRESDNEHFGREGSHAYAPVGSDDVDEDIRNALDRLGGL